MLSPSTPLMTGCVKRSRNMNWCLFGDLFTLRLRAYALRSVRTACDSIRELQDEPTGLGRTGDNSVRPEPTKPRRGRGQGEAEKQSCADGIRWAAALAKTDDALVLWARSLSLVLGYVGDTGEPW